MAIDAVIVAFRIGTIVMDVAQRVAPSDASDQSWSMTVAGLVTAEAAMNSFCAHTVRLFAVLFPCCSNAHGRSAADLAPKLDAAPDQQALC